MVSARVDTKVPDLAVGKEASTMWDTVETTWEVTALHLSHDLPCPRCGHAAHTFLACSDTCDCEPAPMPGVVARAA